MWRCVLCGVLLLLHPVTRAVCGQMSACRVALANAKALLFVSTAPGCDSRKQVAELEKMLQVS